MGRKARSEVFTPDEIATVHVMNRVVRRCFLIGKDPVSGKDYEYRKQWIEDELERMAACFAIDLLNFAILSNHFHLVLRSRPDVVKLWDDVEVARRWLILCPGGKDEPGEQREHTERELKSIASNPDLLAEIRTRLSDISWWMRLLSQRVAQRANREDEQNGSFWQGRFRAVRLLDEAAILAGAAYVDLNPIRAAIAQSLDTSEHTSLARRIEAFRASLALHSSNDNPSAVAEPTQQSQQVDSFLAPLEIDERQDELGPRPSSDGARCSDKGFLAMPLATYLALLNWTARRLSPCEAGHNSEETPPSPEETPPVLERLKIRPDVWCQLTSKFSRLFSLVAGKPQQVDSHRSQRRQTRFHLPKAARELLTS